MFLFRLNGRVLRAGEGVVITVAELRTGTGDTPDTPDPDAGPSVARVGDMRLLGVLCAVVQLSVDRSAVWVAEAEAETEEEEEDEAPARTEGVLWVWGEMRVLGNAGAIGFTDTEGLLTRMRLREAFVGMR